MRCTAMTLLSTILMVGPVFGQTTATREAPLPVADPADVGMSAGILAEVPQALQGLVDEEKIAGAVVCVAKDGKIVLHDAIGYANLEDRKPMEEDTVVRIYSMTKPITSTSVMMLVEEGKIALDDQLSKYIPEFKEPQVYVSGKGNKVKTEPAAKAITVRDLLRHTSGFTYGFFGNTYVDQQYVQASILFPFFDLESTVGKISKVPLLYQPGTRFHYGVSTDVLGRLIEVVSEQTLDEFFQERVFTPLGMQDTGFFVVEANHDRFATNYQLEEGSTSLTVKADLPPNGYLTQPKLFSGGGGLTSTAGDYIRFCQMLLNKGELDGHRLLKPETVEAMSRNQLPKSAPIIKMQGFERSGVGFGLGLSVVVDEVPGSPHVPLGELGWGGAASTHFWLSPQHDLAVVVLTQLMPFTFQAEAIVKPLVYQAIQ